VEELSVSTGTDLIYDSWFQVDEYGPGYVFTGSSFTEEGVEGVITTTYGFIRRHLAIGLDAMFQAVQFPTGITDLNTSLSDVDTDTFPHIDFLLDV